MRKIIGLLVCLLLLIEVQGADMAFRSTSPYLSAGSSMCVSSSAPASSFSAISAANYAALNSEGGACYTPSTLSGPRRVGREDYGDTPPIGGITEHSPVGDTPWALMILLCLGYVAYVERKKIRTRLAHMQKNV